MFGGPDHDATSTTTGETGGLSRRTVLKWSGTAGVLAVAALVTDACSSPALPPGTDPSGLVLLPGFTSRVIARANETIPGTSLGYRIFPDGASTFADPVVAGGWYLTVNHEVGNDGGVTSIRFAPDGTVVSARLHLRRDVTELRRRRHAVGHVAHLRGVRHRPGVGVRSGRLRTGPGRVPAWGRSPTRPPRWRPTAGST